MRWSFRTLCAAALAALGVAGASAQNTLQNAGFESHCGPADQWEAFGNVQSINFFVVTGSRAIKMFGPFCCDVGYSGIQQSLQPCTPGQQWKAGAYATNPNWDALSQGGSVAYVQVDFLSEDRQTVYPGAASAELNAPNDTAQLFETPYATAPEGAAWVRISLLLRQENYIGGAVWWDDVSLQEATLGQVDVPNFSFENTPVGCEGSPAQWWVNFGNGQHNFGENVRTGDYAAKLFGGYNGDPAYSGWYQDVPAIPGSKWKGSGYANSLANDLIRDGNEVFIKIEFRDELGYDLGVNVVSSFVPTGAANSLQYEYYETPVVTAPDFTAYVRFVILQVQHDYQGGATWWDDCELVEVGCAADFDGDGFITGIDFDLYVGAFEAGC